MLGFGLLNTAINKLPIELHLPGYSYCGPGTKLRKRLARGDKGINLLDEACKEHDIAYSKSKDLKDRHEADQKLEELATKRLRSSDAKLGEKAAALTVAGIMKVKRKMGMGYKKCCAKKTDKNGSKTVALRKSVISKAKTAIHKLPNKKNDDVVMKEGAQIALAAARMAVKNAGGRRRIRKPRIIPLPKTGGILPLVPIFAGLSAIGSLIGGTAGIAKAVNDSNTAKKNLEEANRHNKTMEAIAIRNGKGLYLKSHRKGLGLFLGKHPREKTQRT